MQSKEEIMSYYVSLGYMHVESLLLHSPQDVVAYLAYDGAVLVKRDPEFPNTINYVLFSLDSVSRSAFTGVFNIRYITRKYENSDG